MTLYNSGLAQEATTLENVKMDTALPYNLHVYQIKHLRLQEDYCNDLNKSWLFDPDFKANAMLHGNKCSAQNNGGVTVVTLRDVTTGRLYTGIAVCSVRDQYNKKRGITLALNRAWHGYQTSRQVLMPRFSRVKFLNEDFNRLVLLQAIPMESFVE